MERAALVAEEAINLKNLVSHRFTQISTDETLCYARLALLQKGVAKN
jgi:hypothetical protein